MSWSEGMVAEISARRHRFKMTRMGVPRGYFGARFNHLRPHTPQYMAALRKVRGWDPAEQWALVLSGQSGVGKSFLATAKFLELDHPGAKWVGCSSLALQSTERGSGMDAYRRYVRATVLLVDDLGTSSHDRVKDLICERYDHRRTTLFTTNMNAALCQEWDDRCAVRLFGDSEALHINMEGPGFPDLRKQREKKDG